MLHSQTYNNVSKYAWWDARFHIQELFKQYTSFIMLHIYPIFDLNLFRWKCSWRKRRWISYYLDHWHDRNSLVGRWCLDDPLLCRCFLTHLLSNLFQQHHLSNGSESSTSFYYSILSYWQVMYVLTYSFTLVLIFGQ